MSLISAYKPEKRKKTEKLEAYKTIINKHRENYIAISSYKPIDLKYAQQIANYEVVKIRTAYINNVTFNFGNKLRNLINILTNKKGRLTTINNDETKDASSKKESRNKVFEDIKKVKSAVSSRKMEDLPLDENSMTVLKNILDSYSQDYQFDKDSIYYDCKANPTKHFKAYYIIAKTIESLQDSRFIICFPTRITFIPCYITLDTIILNTQILKNKVITHLDKQVVWGAVLNLNSKAIKSSPINQVSFKGTIYTDGVGVSVLKQNYEPGRRRMGGGAIKKKTAEEEEEFRYVEDLTKDELLADVGKCVLVDPGRRDLLYCMHENSTTDNKLVYRYTSNQKNVQRKLKKFAKLRERLKPKELAESEVSLSKHNSASINLDTFSKYLQERAKVSQVLYDYYTNEDIPAGIRATDKLPFRKMKLSSYINSKQAEKRLARDLRTKFGQDPVIVIGNWTAGNVKYHEPIKGVGVRRMLREEGFKVYLLNEFKTSSLCPVCNDGTKLETFKKIPNPRPFREEKNPTVTCHGLLRYTNENCLGSPGRRRLLNRDMAAVLNFRHILLSLRESDEKPTRFLRNSNNNDEPSVTAATVLPTTRPSMKRKASASSSVAGSSRKK